MPHTDEGTLHAHLDGELTTAEAAELQSHLATCAACRERLDAARVVRDRAHSILRRADPSPVAMPDFSTLRARRSVAAAPPAAPPRSNRGLILAWAASVAIALGAGWFAQDLLRGGDRQTVAISSQEAGMAEAAADAASADAPQAVMSPRGPTAAMERTTAGGADGATAARTFGAAAGAELPATVAAEAGPEAATAVAKDLSAEARADAPPSMAAGATETAFAAEPRADGAAPPPPLALRGLPEGAVLDTGSGGWPGSDGWIDVDADAAAERLGRALVTVPDLAVVGQAAAADGSPTVRVTQRLPGGEPVEVLQRVASGAEEVEVVVRAPVPADSLERLRRAVR